MALPRHFLSDLHLADYNSLRPQSFGDFVDPYNVASIVLPSINELSRTDPPSPGPHPPVPPPSPTISDAVESNSVMDDRLEHKPNTPIRVWFRFTVISDPEAQANIGSFL